MGIDTRKSNANVTLLLIIPILLRVHNLQISFFFEVVAIDKRFIKKNEKR